LSPALPASFRRSYLRADFFFGGTFAPDLRASDRPIAIACFRLLTFLPDLPDFNFPRFISCIALPTLAEAFLPYLRELLRVLFFIATSLFWMSSACPISSGVRVEQ
jgi:hypothetical protein